MKKLFSILMILSIVFGIEFVPVRDIPLCLAQSTRLEVKSDLSYIGSKLLETKQNLSINNCHVLETIPYEEVEEEIEEYIYIPTVEDYFCMFPEAVRNAFYEDGWTWEKVDYELGPVFGFGSILGLTIWAEKQIYIDYKDSANTAILHEVGHAFEYSSHVKGVRSNEFIDLYNEHWEEWWNNYGMHIDNYNTPEEAYAQCWEIYILNPNCLDNETRTFIESEIYNIT